MTTSSDSFRNVTRYTGQDYRFAPTYIRPRDPTVNDIKPKEQQGYYPVTSLWTYPASKNIWALASIANNLANWVLISSGGAGPTLGFNVQSTTAPGVSPVTPTGAGLVTVNGNSVANHSVPVETRSRALNAFNVEVQYGSAVAASDATKSGLLHADSAAFDVDANGFLQLNGGGIAATSFPTDSGTAVPSAAGALSVLGQATPNVTGVRFTGSGNTITGSMFSPFAGSFTFTTTGSAIAPGSPIVLVSQNIDNTNTGSDAIVQIGSGGSSGGDAYTQIGVSGSAAWCEGVKNNDGDSHWIAFGNTLTSGTLVHRIDAQVKARTMPLQPAFMAYPNATLTDVTGDGTDYTIVFNTESYDQGSNFSSTTFTAPIAGIYSFNASVFMQQIGGAHTSCAIWFQASSGQITYIWDGDPSIVATSGNLIVNGTARMSLAAAATVTLHILIGGSTKTVDILGAALSGGPTQFSGELLF